jgi:membrane protein implicated in regulation of membrane protease activity
MHTAFDWNTLYLTCFVLGLVLSVIAFFTGAMHLHIGHFHFGHGHHGLVSKNGAHHALGFLNGFTLMAFLSWFGAAGYLLNRYGWFAAPAILGFAILGGLTGAWIIWLFLTKVMMKAERTLEAADTEIVGVLGKVSCTIFANGVGEIIYTQNGSRRSASVRSDDGKEIPRNTEVVVMRYEKGVAWVRRWDDVANGLLGPGKEEINMREP